MTTQTTLPVPVGRSASPLLHRTRGLAGPHALAGSGPGALLLPDVALASLVAVLAPAL